MTGRSGRAIVPIGMDPVDVVGATLPSPCPLPERLLDMASGRLERSDAEALEVHIDVCDSCRVALAAIARREGPGWTLGRYRIDRVLGSGGMGIVYLAWDPALAREVAIKVVRSEHDASLESRLEREARSLARLSHPNVCQVYDVGSDGEEVWIAMELIRGTTLREWFATRPARAEILAMLAGAARGLDAAHAAGLVHRDIKPENVLVDRDGRPVVTDFGLAQVTDATRSSALAGTPAYMAPEQLDGHPADARSDQYAFAVMAHEALAGSRPRPRDVACASLPPAVRAVLERALADDPARRYASIGALVAALAAAATPRRARRRWLVGAAALAVVLAGGALGVARMRGGARAPGAARPAPAVVAPIPAPIAAAPAAVADAAAPVGSASPAGAAPVIPAPVVRAAPVDAGAPRGRPEPPRPAGSAAPPPRPAGSPAPPPRPAGHPAPAPQVASLAADPGTHLALAQRRAKAGDGRGCLAELDAATRLGVPAAAQAATAYLRATCLMLAGQCEAGRQAQLAIQRGNGFAADAAARQADALVSIYCKTGGSDRDHLLHALYVLRDLNHAHPVAECRAAYALALRLAPAYHPSDNHDVLFDAVSALRAGGPACFARAGDCAAAWSAAKEIDERVPRGRGSTDESKRATFDWAVNADCANKDQGPLTDAEVIERAISELEDVHQVASPTVAYCQARVERAKAAFARAGTPARASRLADAARTCLEVTADCATAWRIFSDLLRATGSNDARIRREFEDLARHLGPGCAPP